MKKKPGHDKKLARKCQPARSKNHSLIARQEEIFLLGFSAFSKVIHSPIKALIHSFWFRNHQGIKSLLSLDISRRTAFF